MKYIHDIIDELPTSNMTCRILHALDWVVPGQWTNTNGFTNTVKFVTGEEDEDLIQQVGDRAIALYNDAGEGYQRAMWLYEKVDSIQGWAGKFALVNKIGENVGFLSFLNKITPKADTTQAIDLSIKLVVEVAAFCYTNGLPGDSVSDFAEALTDYSDESLMRIAALICFDGVIPLGPDCIDKVLSLIQRVGNKDLENNERFQNVTNMLPGGSTGEKLDLMKESVGHVSAYAQGFISEKGVTQEGIVGKMRGFMQGIDGKLDYVAAFLDMTTNYFEHTGAQSIARSLINRAMAEI